MTMSEVIGEVNTRNPNAFTEETKAKILCDLESRILAEFKKEDIEVKFPEDFTKTLFLPNRYSEVYILYVSAMIYFWNKEYDEYNNHVSLFSDLLNQFREEHGSKTPTERRTFYNLF